MPDTKILYIAGIYKQFKDTDGRMLGHYSMMTTVPNQSVKEIHNRMPAVLLPDEYDQWLTGDYMALKNRDSVILNKIIA